MDMNSDDSDMLKNKQEIMDYMQCGEKLFKRYLLEGMPARRVGRNYKAHKPALRKWWARLFSTEA